MYQVQKAVGSLGILVLIFTPSLFPSSLPVCQGLIPFLKESVTR